MSEKVKLGAITAGLAVIRTRINIHDAGQAATWMATVSRLRFELENTWPGFDPARFDTDCGVDELLQQRAALLPVLKSSTSCRLCRRWLEGEWNRESSGERRREALESLNRQMRNGRCDPCTVRDARAQLEHLVYDD